MPYVAAGGTRNRARCDTDGPPWSNVSATPASAPIPRTTTLVTALLSVAVTSTNTESPGSRLSCGTSVTPVTTGGSVSATASTIGDDVPLAAGPDAVAVNVTAPASPGRYVVSTAIPGPAAELSAANVSARVIKPAALMTMRWTGKDADGVATAVTSTACRGAALVAAQTLEPPGVFGRAQSVSVTVIPRGPVPSPPHPSAARSTASSVWARDLIDHHDLDTESAVRLGVQGYGASPPCASD